MGLLLSEEEEVEEFGGWGLGEVLSEGAEKVEYSCARARALGNRRCFCISLVVVVVVVVVTRGLDCSGTSGLRLLFLLAHAVEKATPAFVLLASLRQAAQRARVAGLERIEVRMLLFDLRRGRMKNIGFVSDMKWSFTIFGSNIVRLCRLWSPGVTV